MNMTGSEFYAYILRTFIRDDKSTEAYEAITDTIMDMRLFFAFDENKVQAVTDGIGTLGEYKIDLPTECNYIIGDVICHDGTDDSWNLHKVSKEKFDEIYPDAAVAETSDYAVPKHWCLFGKQILIGPVPDKTSYQYEMSYTEEEAAAITSATTAVPFVDRYRETVKAGVLARLFELIDETDRANYWRSVYLAGREAAKQKEYRNASAPWSMRPTNC